MRRLGSPGHRRAPRLVWVEHEELAQYRRCGDLAQGSEGPVPAWVGNGLRSGARGQALTISPGTVPPDSTAPSFPGGPRGDPGEASGQWSHCGLSGSGKHKSRYGMGEVGPAPITPLSANLGHRKAASGARPFPPAPTSSGIYDLGQPHLLPEPPLNLT